MVARVDLLTDAAELAELAELIPVGEFEPAVETALVAMLDEAVGPDAFPTPTE